MKKKDKGNHILPAAIECDLQTGESRVPKYVELTDDEYDKRIIEPAARMYYSLFLYNITSGRLNKNMKD